MDHFRLCNRRSHIIGLLAMAALGSPGLIGQTPPTKPWPVCSPVTTNGNCQITVDRDNPISPLPVKMSHGASVKIVTKKHPLDKVTYETVIKLVTPPDVGLALATSFAPSFKGFVQRTETVQAVQLAPGAPRPPPPPPSPEEALRNRFEIIEDNQRALGNLLQKLHEVDTLLAGKDSNPSADDTAKAALVFNAWKTKVLAAIYQDWVAAATQDDATKTLLADPQKIVAVCLNGADPVSACTKALFADPQKVLAQCLQTIALEIADAARQTAQLPSQEFTGYLDAANANQLQFAIAINSVPAGADSRKKYLQVADILNKLEDKNASDPATSVAKLECSSSLFEYRCWYPAQATDRMGTVTISAANLLSTNANDKPITVATVQINWGSSRWEISTGALFSFLPNRQFQAAGIIANGIPSRDSSGKINTQLVETTSRPTSVVPFVLGHYRLWEWDAPKIHRLAILFSGGAGVNPTSASTDFGLGPSLALRSITISPLLYFARDLRLTQGLYVGEQLGSSPPTPSTERYWVRKFGFSITYALPIGGKN